MCRELRNSKDAFEQPVGRIEDSSVVNSQSGTEQMILCRELRNSKDAFEQPVGRIEDSSVVNSQSEFTTILDSSMVEHAAVNRGVVGSSPTRGVLLSLFFSNFLLFCNMMNKIKLYVRY